MCGCIGKLSQANNCEAEPEGGAENVVAAHTTMNIRAGLGSDIFLTTVFVNVNVKMLPARMLLESTSTQTLLVKCRTKNCSLIAYHVTHL
jgi:hypothetical protein